MGKLLMIAGGIVLPDSGQEATMSAYVVLSAGHLSRIFKVSGPQSTAKVTELPSATTVDMKRFQGNLEQDLMPVLDAFRAKGKAAHIARPADTVACDRVREHLKATEGLDAD